MKYLLLFLLFYSFSSYSQKSKEEIYYQYEQKENKTIDIKFHTQVDWKIENENNWGSFMWHVIRTLKPDQNNDYWYYVYLYSNSYFNKLDENGNYQKAITYISDLHVYMTEYNSNNIPSKVYEYYVPYTTCDHYIELDPLLYVAVFSSKSKINTFNIKFGECTPYYNTKIKK